MLRYVQHDPLGYFLNSFLVPARAGHRFSAAVVLVPRRFFLLRGAAGAAALGQQQRQHEQHKDKVLFHRKLVFCQI